MVTRRDARLIIDKWRRDWISLGRPACRWISLPDPKRARALIELGIVEEVSPVSTEMGVYCVRKGKSE